MRVPLRCWQKKILLCVLLLSTVSVSARDLLRDSHFVRGVEVAPLVQAPFFQQKSKSPVVCLPQSDCSLQPQWKLQQWLTAQDIATGEHVAPQSGVEQWLLQDKQNRVQKKFQLAPGDFANGDVWLELNGQSEFAARQADGVQRYLPDLRSAWPHLLLAQRLDSGRLTQYRSLPLRGELRIPFDNLQQQPGYNRNVHSARLVLAITVRNRLNGNYFWLNLPIYDDRLSATDFGCQKCVVEADGLRHCRTPQALRDVGEWHCPADKVGDNWRQNEKRGTARMIFRLPTQAFMTAAPVAGGDWTQVSVDLLPYVLAGIDAVRQRGEGLFPADLFFYELGLFSVGWEITGFNHAAAQLRNWQLEGEPLIADSP